MSTSQTNLNSSQHCLGRPSSSLFLCKKIDQKTGCPCTSGVFNVRFNYSIFTAVIWLTTDTCHVYGTKHGSDLSIVGSFATFHTCVLFITLTVIILCNAF